MKIKYSEIEFGKAIKKKRIIDLDIDLRQAAKKTGLSAPTISRIENGGIPDINTFAILCYWANLNMKDYFKLVKAK